MYQKYKSKIHLPYTSQPKFYIPSFVIQFFKSKPVKLKNNYLSECFFFFRYIFNLCNVKKTLKEQINYKKKYLSYIFNKDYKIKYFLETEIKSGFSLYIKKNFFFYYFSSNKRKKYIIKLLNFIFFKFSLNLLTNKFNKNWIFLKFKFRFFFIPFQQCSNNFIFHFARIFEHINNHNK